MNRIWVKLSAVITLLVLLLMIVVFRLITLRQIKTERDQLRDHMERIAMQIASIRLTSADDLLIYQEWIKGILDSPAGKDIVYIAIYDRNRRLFAYALNPQYLDVPSPQLLTPEDEVDIIQRLSRGEVAEESWNDFDHVPVEIRTGRLDLGRVDVGFSLIDFNNRARRNLLINVYILAGAFAAVAGLSILIGRRITQPLERLSAAMLDVSHGNLDVRVSIKSRDELGKLIDSFNYMTLRLREKRQIEMFSQDLMLFFEHEKLLQLVIERIVGYLGADYGALFLLENRGETTAAVSRWSAPIPLQATIEETFDQDCLYQVVGRLEPFFIDKNRHAGTLLRLQERLKERLGADQFVLASPMVSQGEVLGFVLLSHETDGSHYDGDELMFLRTLCGQAGMAVRNSMLLRDLTLQQRLQKELEIARQVQAGLLPDREPCLDGLQLAGACLPAEKVGGDYYDYFVLDDHRLGIAVADVSGKGTSAAFYMAEIKGMMSSMTQFITSPKELMRRLNRLLCRTVDRRIFTTMLYGIIDLAAGEFVFVRAGHNPLLVRHADGTVDLLVPRGMALGLAGDELFDRFTEEYRLPLRAGDILFIFTDGLTDARNATNEEFGEERLAAWLRACDVADPMHIRQQILQKIDEFAGGAVQHDDITLVIAAVAAKKS
ncbi:MAG: SpoIIE family protein phosphatase [candidate division KSB1 bacterium]|nr:SpoIIE family protein phosphatase [candidate division KSB1 bacterium]